jgi:hypothetical protein
VKICQKGTAVPVLLDMNVFGHPVSGSGIICTDQDLVPDPSTNKQKSKKTLDFYYFGTLFDFLPFKTDVTVW